MKSILKKPSTEKSAEEFGSKSNDEIRGNEVEEYEEYEECEDEDELEEEDIAEILFYSITNGEKETLDNLFELSGDSISFIQTLICIQYANNVEPIYDFDEEDIAPAHELLGSSVVNLNALHMAIILGDEEMAVDILNYFKKYSEKSNSKMLLREFMGRTWGAGNTALHLASFMEMSEVVALLLKLGASKNKRNDKGNRPQDCTFDPTVAELFRTVEPDEILPPEQTRAEELNSDSGSSLKRKGTLVKVNETKAKDSMNTLTRRKTIGNTLGRTLTLRKKTQPTIQPTSNTNNTNKKQVAFHDDSYFLYLCEYGVDIRADYLQELERLVKIVDVPNLFTPQKSMTALHIACTHGDLEITKLLLEKTKVKVNAADDEGWTPLHCACAEGNLEVIELLGLCKGKGDGGFRDGGYWPPDGPIDVEPINNEGETPENTCLDDKKKEIKNILSTLRIKYPPPKREIIKITSDSDADDDDDESLDEEADILTDDGGSTDNLASSDINKPTTSIVNNTSNISSNNYGPTRDIKQESFKLSSSSLSGSNSSIPVSSNNNLDKVDSKTALNAESKTLNIQRVASPSLSDVSSDSASQSLLSTPTSKTNKRASILGFKSQSDIVSHFNSLSAVSSGEVSKNSQQTNRTSIMASPSRIPVSTSNSSPLANSSTSATWDRSSNSNLSPNSLSPPTQTDSEARFARRASRRISVQADGNNNSMFTEQQLLTLQQDIKNHESSTKNNVDAVSQLEGKQDPQVTNTSGVSIARSFWSGLSRRETASPTTRRAKK